MSKEDKMGLRKPPFVFTEQGVAMLSSVLNNERAIEINIAIMRSFVSLRKFALTYEDLTKRMTEIEQHFPDIYKALNHLMDFIKEFTADTGILLDPVYTGKMMLAIKKLCISGDIKKGDKVIAIHTGGLTGWFGKVDEL